MNEIVVVGDVHEGLNFPYRIEPETGISARALDIHSNFAKAAKYAIENEAGLFVILGDLFDRTNVSPNFRELVRKDVIEPLGEAGINVWILAGNHDQPHSAARSTSLEDYRGYPHVKIYRKPCVEEILNGALRCIILPYMHPEQIAALVMEREKKEIPQEQIFPAAQELLTSWIRNRVNESKAEHNVLFSHYYVEGAKIRETSSPEILPGEFSLRKETLPVDLAVLGHIHLHQVIGGKIVYAGAVERIDFGEREDKKGFVVLNVRQGISWKFIELPCREMLKINVEIAADENPMPKILDAIPDVREKLVRIEIKLGEGQRSKIAEHKIAEKLKDAFHYEVRWTEKTEEKRGIAHFTMSPLELLRGFIEINYSQHPKKEELMMLGEEIVREVLE